MLIDPALALEVGLGDGLAVAAAIDADGLAIVMAGPGVQPNVSASPAASASGRITRGYAAGARSGLDGDHVRLDLAVDRAASEPLRDRFRRSVGRFAEPRGIARLDLVPQRRPFAVADCRDPR